MNLEKDLQRTKRKRLKESAIAQLRKRRKILQT